ncbi:MAG: ATP-binding cassette domain-containing protein [Spirochaetes bacterium]|nr:ATP-binding cassette domain-containing protein [Spirochaetota bacterium]
MILLEKLTKQYTGSSLPALDRIDLSINPGEITVIFGENGAGKSTLIKIISCLLEPTTGNCYINGYHTVKEKHGAKKICGMLMGAETGLYARLTAYENIKYFADLNRIPAEIFKSRLDYFSGIFNMHKYLNRRCGEFSFGMKQKTAIARAFIHDPEIILLDEPTTGLDITSSLIMHDFIRRCRQEGKTIIFSTHRMDEITKLADRIIILKEGSAVYDNMIKNTGRSSRLEKILLKYISK